MYFRIESAESIRAAININANYQDISNGAPGLGSHNLGLYV